MSTTNVPTPTYDDGFRKGFDAAVAEVREEQLASVFDRDSAHVYALADAASAIQRGLGSVSESEVRVALPLAGKLVDVLDAAAQSLAEIANEHRREAKRLAEERWS